MRADAVAISFDQCGGIIFLPVRVNGSPPLSFVLDSGFEESVLDPQKARALGLPLKDTRRVSAPGGSTDYSSVDGVALHLPGMDLPVRAVAAVPVAQFAPFFGHDVDGILGYDFFAHFVVEIDYATSRIFLYDPDRYTGQGMTLPLALETRQSYVSASILPLGRDFIDGRFEIDTGSMDAVTLNTPFVEAHQLLAPTQKVFPLRGISLGGETNALLARMDGLQLGRVVIEHPIAGIVKEDVDRAGQIGAEILRRFTVVFDYPQQCMMLEPNLSFADPFEFDMSGVLLTAEPPSYRTFRVFSVLEDSPAAQAGLRIGDRIVAIDGQPAEQFTLQDVRHLFKREGRRYLVQVKRGEDNISAAITLRKLI